MHYIQFLKQEMKNKLHIGDRLYMKTLLINGSPRINGCTNTTLTELKNTLEQESMEVELIHVGNKDIRGCIACRRCHETGK